MARRAKDWISVAAKVITAAVVTAGIAAAAGVVWGGVWVWDQAFGPVAQEHRRAERLGVVRQGWQACSDGIPAEACQYPHPAKNESSWRGPWMEGWQMCRRGEPMP